MTLISSHRAQFLCKHCVVTLMDGSEAGVLLIIHVTLAVSPRSNATQPWLPLTRQRDHVDPTEQETDGMGPPTRFAEPKCHVCELLMN